ncbi:MAG: hypothetical protein Kow0047_04760 [Anaerolineae bacterium]
MVAGASPEHSDELMPGLDTGEVNDDAETQRLKAPLRTTFIIFGVVWVSGAAVAAAMFPGGVAWAGPSAVALAWEALVLRRHIGKNHPPQRPGTPFGTLGAANALTLARGAIIALLAGIVVLPWPAAGYLAWLPGGLYALAVALDHLDGRVARGTHRVTELGAILDIEFDGLGMLVVTVLTVRLGRLPPWYVVTGLAYYLFWWSVTIRRRRGHPTYDLPPSRHRRVLASVQMGFMVVALMPWPPTPVVSLVGSALAVPFLGGFLRDWLFVHGWLRAESRVYRRAVAAWDLMTHFWLLPALRLGASLIGIRLALIALGLQHGWLMGLAMLVASLLLGLGVAARMSAILLMAAIGGYVTVAPWNAGHVLALIAGAVVLQFGSGRASAWPVEDEILYR